MAKNKILNRMRARLEMAQNAYADSRRLELEDLKFLAGSPDNQWQWPDAVINERQQRHSGIEVSRPCLTINKLPPHVKQVTNDQKENRPAGNVIPTSNDGDEEVAEVYGGIIRHIEYISDADVAYDTACEAQVSTGEGYYRLITQYVDDTSFDQEIRIARIRNQFSVFLDPTMQDPCGVDASWGFITTDMLFEEYESDFPDASPVSSLVSSAAGDDSLGSWISERTIRIAEYFYISEERKEIALYEDLGVVEIGSEMDLQAKAEGLEPIKTRTAAKKVVHWVKTNGYEILEEQVWPGSFIPIIRVIGNEWEIEGELHISGLVRNAKDPQRMYNYWSSQEAEMLALAPKAPFVGYSGQFEGFEDKWETANSIPWPYLEVNREAEDGQGNPLPLPQRSQPVAAQQGLIAAKMAAADDIKSTTGQYDSALGQTSNERSGKAILARERQADTGTFHYVDNLARAIRHSSRQIIELIPIIYDTKRVVQIMGLDGKPGKVSLDPSLEGPRQDILDEQGNVIDKIYNPSVGKYDIAVKVGKSYTTMRQESAENMALMVQGNPELWQVFGDLLVENFDWPGAKTIAERIKRSLDPKLLDEGQNPELVQARQQIEQLAQQNQQLMQMLQNIQKSFEARELDIKEYDAETKRFGVVKESMTPQQVHDTIQGAIDGVIDSGQLSGVAKTTERGND